MLFFEVLITRMRDPWETPRQLNTHATEGHVMFVRHRACAKNPPSDITARFEIRGGRDTTGRYDKLPLDECNNRLTVLVQGRD